MAKDTIHQKIWKRTENGLEISIPKIIRSDIGFQLMFGKNEDYDYEQSFDQEASRFLLTNYIYRRSIKRFV